MLEKQITEEELEIVETLSHPRALAECLFSDGRNLSLFEEDKFIEIRMGQYPLLSYEYMIAEDPQLPEKENFERRKKAGEICVLGGRLFGKTWTVEKIDFCEYAFWAKNETAGFSSFDDLHLKGVLDEMYNVWQIHPILKIIKQRIVRSPHYLFVTKNGVTIEGINMKTSAGSSAGDQFLQKHFERLWIEEKSKENDIVKRKRIASKSEIGCIFREAGMTDFVKNSPAGEVFHDLKQSWKILNLPQYVNPNYDRKQEEEEIKLYGGRHSLGFRIYVDGEVVEDGETVFDMATVRDLCYPHKKDGDLDEKRTVKHIEFTKKNVEKYRQSLILVRPGNVDKIFVCADIGKQGGITEIIIVAKIKERYNYLYNITLRNIPKPETEKILKQCLYILNAEYLALDSTGGMGEAIFLDFQEDPTIPNDSLIWVAFNENVPIGLEYDDKGNVAKKNGKPVEKLMNAVDWSIQRACHILYSGLIFLPYDGRLDEQLDKVIAIVSKVGNILYHCVAPENHLWQAFQVFFIAQWLWEYGAVKKTNKPSLNEQHCKTGI